MISTSPRVLAKDFRRQEIADRIRELGESPEDHRRKYWEWAVICQTFLERVLDREPSPLALGFGVGREPIAAWLADRGAWVLATDWHDGAGDWSNNQNAAALEDIPQEGICHPEDFLRRVQFQLLDMRAIPGSLRKGLIDFTWSSGSMEHIGGIEATLRFFCEQMECLRPGGIAAHTTELLANEQDTGGETINENTLCLLRPADLEELGRRLEAQGDRLLPLDLQPGVEELDGFVDRYPYDRPHLSIGIDHNGQEYVTTSVLLVAVRGEQADDRQETDR